MESFDVELHDFTVVRRERHEKVGGHTVTEIVYKALDQSSLDKRELGYIQFLLKSYTQRLTTSSEFTETGFFRKRQGSDLDLVLTGHSQMLCSSLR
jgi:hypothetical protein